MTERTITLLWTASGHSETLPLQSTTTLGDVLEWSKALFGWDRDDANHNDTTTTNNNNQQQQQHNRRSLVLFKDGQPLWHPLTFTLEQAGIQNGDLLAVSVPDESSVGSTAPPPAATAAPTTAAAAAGLDFSNLLAASSSSSTPLLRPAAPAPVYYPGMNLNEAMQYNPHPHAFVRILSSQQRFDTCMHACIHACIPCAGDSMTLFHDGDWTVYVTCRLSLACHLLTFGCSLVCTHTHTHTHAYIYMYMYTSTNIYICFRSRSYNPKTTYSKN